MRRFPKFLLFGIAAAALGYGASFISLQYRARTVISGDSYRSGQLSAHTLEHTIDQYQIRSIINLRGANYDKRWYQEEVTVAKRKHVTHFDIALSAKRALTPEQQQALRDIFKIAPRPMLIHCDQGIERTNKALDLYRELREHPESTPLSLSQNAR